MMLKFSKIAILFSMVFFLFIGIANAETTNLYNNIANENTSNTTTNSTDEEETIQNDTTNESVLEDDLLEDTNQTSTPPNINSNARINTISSIPEANLGLNNVLCIILIALGILIILLAIAILIRLKK